MPRLTDERDLAVAVWRTWGARGLRRRAAYEVAKRSGALRRGEASWLSRATGPAGALRPIGVTPLATSESLPPGTSNVVLYGGLAMDVDVPPNWHRHPITGHVFDAASHWSELSDASVEAGDIKDVWELSRFGWLYPRLRAWAATHDEVLAEEIWRVVEDWGARNAPYAGPHWMCGQETSLRAITVMFFADALAASAATTPERQSMVAALVRVSVGRVAPTIGYALSQRNNHAISEAGFLWTASLVADDLPDAAALRRHAAAALVEAVADQFEVDGSYAQHSPTYHRLALHVLLWCLHIAHVTGEAPPAGVTEAIRRSVPFLRSLVVPGSAGRVPNLGGNDGALLFDLSPLGIADFRPAISHAAVATGQASGFGEGPWDDEPRWFGLAPTAGTAAGEVSAVTTHALTRGSTHAVVRAGPLRHRPAHADQLHTDVWLDGRAVAVDSGSYRYTAPGPWGNALAGDDVHNVPRRVAAPQATRAGRFFWRRWTDATVRLVVRDANAAALLGELCLPDGTVTRRLVAVRADLVVVIDQATAPVLVRWNLPSDVAVATRAGATSLAGQGWIGHVAHGEGAWVPAPREDDPASGWHAPTYGVLDPLTAFIAPSTGEGRVVSCFAAQGRGDDFAGVVATAESLDLGTAGEGVIASLLQVR